MRIVAVPLTVTGLALLALAPAVGADTPCAAARCHADLSVSSLTSASPVAVGGVTELHLTAANNGPEPASGVAIDFTPPGGVQIAALPGPCTANGPAAHCTIGDLAAGETSEVVITVRGAKVGLYELRSQITETGSDDGNATNDTGSSGLQVEAAASAPATRPAPTGTPAPGTSTTGLTTKTAPMGTKTAPSGTGPRFEIDAARRQRILTTGGLLLHVTAQGRGDLDASASVTLSGGRTLALAGVFRKGVRTGQSVRVWIGTTPAMKRALRAGFVKHGRLVARVRIRYGVTPRTRVVVRSITITR